MDEGRLKVVKKRRDYNRRFVHMMNYLSAKRHESYAHYIDTEKAVLKSRYVSDALAVKRAIVRSRWLNQFMRVKKQDSKFGAVNLNYGDYQGKTVESYGKEIDQKISWNHPQLRRMRRVEGDKSIGVEEGRFLNDEGMRSKMDEFINKCSKRDRQTEAINRKLRDETSVATNKITSTPLENMTYFLQYGLPKPAAPKAGSGGQPKINWGEPSQRKSRTPKEIEPLPLRLDSDSARKSARQSSRQSPSKSPVKLLPPILTSSRESARDLETSDSTRSSRSIVLDLSSSRSRSNKTTPKQRKGQAEINQDTRQSKDLDQKQSKLPEKAVTDRPSDKVRTVKLIMSGRTKEETTTETKTLPPVKEKRDISDMLKKRENTELRRDKEKTSGSLYRAPTLILPPIETTKDMMKHLSREPTRS